MERITIVNCAVLCVALLLLRTVLSAPPQDDHQISARNQKFDDKKQSYLWFGPRLGRKKRNPNSEDSYRNAEIEREQLATLMEMIQDSPWAIIAVNDGKRHTVNFTPRLGRESGEEFLTNDRWLQDAELSGELLSQRSPPFAPRLGRHLSPFSPRLGRENEKNQMS